MTSIYKITFLERTFSVRRSGVKSISTQFYHQDVLSVREVIRQCQFMYGEWFIIDILPARVNANVLRIAEKDSFKPLVSSFTVQIWPIFKTIPTANQLQFIGNLIKWYLEVCTCTRDAAIHIRNRLATNDTDWPPDVVYLSDNAYKAQFHDNDDKHRSWPVSFTCHMHTLRENESFTVAVNWT